MNPSPDCTPVGEVGEVDITRPCAGVRPSRSGAGGSGIQTLFFPTRGRSELGSRGSAVVTDRTFLYRVLYPCLQIPRAMFHEMSLPGRLAAQDDDAWLSVQC